jgi:glucan phosphorylase
VISTEANKLDGFDSLADLALNLRWSWNHATDEVWRQLDPELWEITHNPWVVLQTASRDRIKSVLTDPVFRKNVDGLVETRRKLLEAPAWEACGTSGMKVLVNGGVNISELDGWWAEAYTPEVVGPWEMAKNMAKIRPGTVPKRKRFIGFLSVR